MFSPAFSFNKLVLSSKGKFVKISKLNKYSSITKLERIIVPDS